MLLVTLAYNLARKPSPFARQGAGVESVRVLSSGPLSFYTMQYGQDGPAHTGLYRQSKEHYRTTDHARKGMC